MEKKKVSFVNTRNRGLTPDLKIVKEYLASHMDNVEFSYLTVNENSENFMVQMGAKSAKKEYCSTALDIICVDGSLPVKLAKTATNGKKILISTPYDYQFNAMSKEGGKKNTFKSFSHIIPCSQFGKELLKKKYKLPVGQIIEGVASPMAWDMNQKKRIKEKRDKFENYFPASKGKKILSILVTGVRDEETPNPYAAFNWEPLLNQLGEEWFVFINSEDALESAIHLDAKNMKQLGFVHRLLDARELLYFSDCIVTNSGMYASYFSSKKKPVYCVRYKENAFERYMKKHYPSLYIEKLEDIIGLPIAQQEYGSENEKFGEYFSYNIEKNPCKVILDLLLEK